MIRVFTLIFLLTCLSKSYAQQVKVVDFDTQLPVSDCTIYNDLETKMVVTNKQGLADITIFNDIEILTFQHATYIELDILKKHLVNSNFKIQLYKKAESLDEVVLSVGRQKESRSRIAKQVEINSEYSIQKLAPQSSADLLARFPGVRVQKSQAGGGSPVLRGMEANRVLLVVDGVRMNNAIYRSGHLQNSITVAPSILERTEVVFGPSSVIYGSDALGGVIHYYTKTPRLSEEPKTTPSYMSRYSTINDEFTNQGAFEISFKKWASFTSFTYSKFGDSKMGKNRNHGYDDWGKVFQYSNNTETYYNPNPVVNSDPNIQKNTGYEQYDFLQKLYFELTPTSDLSLNFQHSNSSIIPRFDRLTEYSDGELKFAEWYYGPQKRLLASGQYQFAPNKKWLQKGTITGAYQKINESRINRKFNSLDKTFRYEHVDVYSVNGDFSVPLSKRSNRNLSYGFEVAHNNVFSRAEGNTLFVDGNDVLGYSGSFNVQTRYPDGGSNYTSAAVYTSYRQDISQKATLNTGIRFTNTNLNAKWIDESFITLPDDNIHVNNSALTATIGYVYKPTLNWQINTVLSSGFRSPNIDDIGKIREKGGFVTVPNIHLKPEYAYNAELGVIKYFNEKNWYLGGNLFYTLLNNYIARAPYWVNGSPTIIYDGEEVETVANLNHGNAYITGVSLKMDGRFLKNWRAKGSVTYTKGRGYDTNEPLSSIPPIFGNIEINYSKNKFEGGIFFIVNGEKDIEDFNLIEGIDNVDQSPTDSNGNFVGTPSWNTFNLYAKYKIRKNIALQINADNIFDNHYKEFASAISGIGRNYSFSIFIN
ncbi:TonB-dependent receptor [Urechidicola sp. KH5]